MTKEERGRHLQKAGECIRYTPPMFICTGEGVLRFLFSSCNAVSSSVRRRTLLTGVLLRCYLLDYFQS
jgi:hypothetical protein